MKIALIGGGGYLGSTIHQELQKHNTEVVIFDNGLFSDEYLSIVAHQNINILTESYDFSKFDKILWCCDIDDENFYKTTFSQDYIEKNLEVFKNFCKIYMHKMCWVKDVCENLQPEYQEMLDRKTEMIVKAEGEFYPVGELYGPSARMRFDTLINEMFKMAVTEGAIYIDKWLENVFVSSVALTAKNIALDLVGKGTYVQDGVCLSKLEFAYRIVIVFERKIGIVTSDEMGYAGRSILTSNQEDGEFTIEKSLIYMREALERGAIDNIMKDIYNNSRIIANFIASDNFFKFKNEIVG